MWPETEVHDSSTWERLPVVLLLYSYLIEIMLEVGCGITIGLQHLPVADWTPSTWREQEFRWE